MSKISGKTILMNGCMVFLVNQLNLAEEILVRNIYKNKIKIKFMKRKTSNSLIAIIILI